jgi:hypothetical protein
MVGENQNFSGAPLPEQAERLLKHPETARLIALLRSDGGKRLEQAAAALKQGRTEDAKAILSPLLEQTDAAELSDRLAERQ